MRETDTTVLCDRLASLIDNKHQLLQFLDANSLGRSNHGKWQSQHFTQRSIQPRNRDIQMVGLHPVPQRHIQQSVVLMGVEKSSGKIKSLLDRTVDLHLSVCTPRSNAFNLALVTAGTYRPIRFQRTIRVRRDGQRRRTCPFPIRLASGE